MRTVLASTRSGFNVASHTTLLAPPRDLDRLKSKQLPRDGRKAELERHTQAVFVSNQRRQKPCNLFVGSRRHFVSSQIYKKTSQSVMRVTLQPRGGGSGCVSVRYCALLLIIAATKVKNQGSRRARLGQAIPAMLLEGARHGHTMGVVSGPGGGVPSRATFVEPSSPARSLRREWYDFLLYSQVTGAKPEIDHRKGAVSRCPAVDA